MTKLRCFVAMAFGRDDIDQLYDQVIKKTISALDIIPVRVDRVTHNDRIDSKIRNEIQKADLLVADLTYARPSVYWEAGFGERVNPVIYTCRSDHFKRISEKEDPSEVLKVHFDPQNANIIKWSAGTTSQFRNELRQRISFVVTPYKVEKRHKATIEKSRVSFDQISLVEKQSSAWQLISRVVASKKFHLAPQKERTVYVAAHYRDYPSPTEITAIGTLRWKLVREALIRLYVIFPKVRLEERYLRELLLGVYSRNTRYQAVLGSTPVAWENLQDFIKKESKRRVRAVRNIWLLTSINGVPQQRPQKVLTSFRRIGDHKYFFRPSLQEISSLSLDRTQDLHLLPTSHEVYFIDGIRSLLELKSRVNDFVGIVENTKSTLVRPSLEVIAKNRAG